MTDAERCSICLGPKTGDSILFCEDCGSLISQDPGHTKTRVPSSVWWPWVREKTRVKRAANILKYGETKWERE